MKDYKIFILLAFILASCIEPYNFPGGSFEDLLVVEAKLYSASQIQEVRLSRTREMNSNIPRVESNAQVWIMDDDVRYDFIETTPGIYKSLSSFSSEIGHQYQLHIVTASGDVYESSIAELKETPPIQQVTWEYDANPAINGIRIFVDTEDPTGASRYYLWEFDETYEIRVPNPSYYNYIDVDEIETRPLPLDIQRCWEHNSSKSIIIGTSANLAEDKIVKFPLVIKRNGLRDFRFLYSINVKQYVISQDTYAYLYNLQQVNQSSGGLFDLVPGSLEGNIRHVNGTKNPIGLFLALDQEEERLFISGTESRQSGYSVPQFEFKCDTGFFFNTAELDNFFAIPSNRFGYRIFSIDFEATNLWIVYPAECSDCTYFSQNNRPDFWPPL
jgi:hypothetical protein